METLDIIGIKRIIFDLDGTLIPEDYSFEMGFFTKCFGSIKATSFVRDLSSFLAWYEQMYCKYDDDTLIEMLYRLSGLKLTKEMLAEWRRLVRESCKNSNLYVSDTLEYLKGKGYSLAVLTNWFTSDQEYKLKRCGIIEYFDNIYGGDICLKPHEKSYEIACGGFSRDECLMIGDNILNDVLIPIKYGIDSIFYNPSNKNIFSEIKSHISDSVDIDSIDGEITCDVSKIDNYGDDIPSNFVKVKSIKSMSKIKEMF